MQNKMDTKVFLSTLWLFATLNYIFCDVVGLMDANLLNQFLSGSVQGISMTQEFLLLASILVEIPIAMVLLSRVLNYKINRFANILFGAFMTIVQVATVFIGSSTNYYIFFSLIEIATTLFIVWTAWNWKE